VGRQGKLGILTAALGILAGGTPALADNANPETVIVIGNAPADVQSVSPVDISASHADTATALIDQFVPSVFLSDTESNPFQEDLYYRGFDASPVLGTPQGLAIYQGATRINQHFGDTVLWDLVPSFAIHSIDVVPGSDPVFGLNALGGAIRSMSPAAPSAAHGSFSKRRTPTATRRSISARPRSTIPDGAGGRDRRFIRPMAIIPCAPRAAAPASA
jgi:hypothetical protein